MKQKVKWGKMTTQQGNPGTTKEPLDLRDFFAKVNSSGVRYEIVRCIPTENLLVRVHF